MKVEEALSELEFLGDERMRAQNARNGAGPKQFDVRLGEIRNLAKQIKSDHSLGMMLWPTENVDARLLAILIIKPKDLSPAELDAMVRSITLSQVADWLNAYVVKKHPDREALRERWMTSDDPMAARAGWNMISSRVAKDPQGLDLNALLDRLEVEMGGADPTPQWTMNFCLAEIGINVPDHRDRAIEIDERLGVYRDYPTSKGCTLPFAPIWINEMVRRQD